MFTLQPEITNMSVNPSKRYAMRKKRKFEKKVLKNNSYRPTSNFDFPAG